MWISSPTRIRLGFGRRAKTRLQLAGLLSLSIAFVSIACSDDDPAPAPEAAGGATTVPDASVRDLPGDGLEPTPESDTDSRQREPIGPERLVETIEEIRNDIDGTPSEPPGGAPDASPGEPGVDAGAD